MRRVLYVLAALSMTALSCSKEDEIMDKVDVPDRGRIRFINISKDPYDIYLDGSKMGSMYGGDTVVIPNVLTGARKAKAIQTNNYVSVPNTSQETLYLLKDSIATFVYPQ